VNWLREQFLRARQDVLSWPAWMQREARKMVASRQAKKEIEEGKFLTREEVFWEDKE